MSASLPRLNQILWEPRQAVAQIRSLNLSQAHVMMGVLVVALLKAVVVSLLFSVTKIPEGAMVVTPITVAFQSIVYVVMLTVVFTFAGRFYEGTAQLQDMAIAQALNMIVTIPIQILVMFAGTLAPGLVPLVTALVAGYGIWYFSSVVAEAHGFERTRTGFFMVIMTVIALSFVLALLIGFFQPALFGG